jgi:hypothetical protein
MIQFQGRFVSTDRLEPGDGHLVASPTPKQTISRALRLEPGLRFERSNTITVLIIPERCYKVRSALPSIKSTRNPLTGESRSLITSRNISLISGWGI